jgi:hypothetical protein
MPRFDELQIAFAGHLRNPDHAPAPRGLEERRVAIYRELLFNNLSSLLSANFPVIRRLLAGDDWPALVRSFYVEHASHTPLFYEIASEFVRFLGDHPEHYSERRPFLHELAHYEWAELALDLDEHELVAAGRDGDPIDGVPVASKLAWVLGYHYPVHLIKPDFQPTEPPAEPTWLLVYRNRADRVQFQSLQPLSARLLALIQEHPGRTGREHLQQLATEIAHPDVQQLVDMARPLLNDWLARDVLV